MERHRAHMKTKGEVLGCFIGKKKRTGRVPSVWCVVVCGRAHRGAVVGCVCIRADGGSGAARGWGAAGRECQRAKGARVAALVCYRAVDSFAGMGRACTK